MAHFCELDVNNVVTRVIVVDNINVMNPQGQEVENIGILYCQNLFGGGIWKQTSYNATIRKNYAGIGYTFDNDRNAFISPKPHNSWVLNEETCKWEAPIPYPDATGDGIYTWNEQTLSWDLME